MLPDGADSLDSIFESLSDNTLKNFIDSLDETERATITVGEAMQRMGTQTTTVTQTVSRSSAAFKTFASIGKTLLSTLGNIALTMAATWVAGKVIEGVSDFINKEEIAIEKGKEAAETIRGIKDEINKKTSFNDENAERFGELREANTIFSASASRPPPYIVSIIYNQPYLVFYTHHTSISSAILQHPY